MRWLLTPGARGPASPGRWVCRTGSGAASGWAGGSGWASGWASGWGGGRRRVGRRRGGRRGGRGRGRASGSARRSGCTSAWGSGCSSGWAWGRGPPLGSGCRGEGGSLHLGDADLAGDGRGRRRGRGPLVGAAVEPVEDEPVAVAAADDDAAYDAAAGRAGDLEPHPGRALGGADDEGRGSLHRRRPDAPATSRAGRHRPLPPGSAGAPVGWSAAPPAGAGAGCAPSGPRLAIDSEAARTRAAPTASRAAVARQDDPAGPVGDRAIGGGGGPWGRRRGSARRGRRRPPARAGGGAASTDGDGDGHGGAGTGTATGAASTSVTSAGDGTTPSSVRTTSR